MSEDKLIILEEITEMNERKTAKHLAGAEGPF